MDTNDDVLNEKLARDMITAAIAAIPLIPFVEYPFYKYLNSRPESTKEKIEAVQTVEDEVDSPEFTKIADDIIKKLEAEEQKESQQVSQSSQQQVSPESDTEEEPEQEPKPTPEEIRQQILRDAAAYITPFELYGGIDSSENDKFMSPYQDDHKLWTIGIGHLLGKGTSNDKARYIQQRKAAGKPVKLSRDEALSIFQKDLNRVYNTLLRVFGDQWYQFPDDLKVALVDVAFRGDLASRQTGRLHKFVGMLKRGEYKAAAEEYLDHKEYKKRVKKGEDSVVRRMNSNHEIMRNAQSLEEDNESYRFA